MNIAIKIDKNELDYQVVSLSKQKEEYDKLLYYYKKTKKGIIELKHDVDDKLSRIIKLYTLL
ncbi:MAG: hypothetical protein ACFFDK_07035 [Promethearchaeota archaeon]